MVEMGSNGIRVNQFKADEQGEMVYFLRMKPEATPLPLIRAADTYLSAQVKYDYPDLALLAGLLIYRAVRPTRELQRAIDTILALVWSWTSG